MNNSIAVPNQGPWPLQPYAPGQPQTLQPGQRTYSAAGHLDLPTLLRIVQHWRWLIIGAVAIGLALAIIITLLTTPVYRAWVTLEVNPPTVNVSDEQSKERETYQNPYDVVATQVGLLTSKSVAERTAQELNLGNNPDFVEQAGDASSRLRAATNEISLNLNAEVPKEGQLIKFSFDSISPQLAASVANGVAESFINSSLQRRYEASTYARRFLERQIAKTRGDLEKSERSLVAYAQQQGIINTAIGPDGKPANSDAGSPQGESLMALNKALADATARRVAAEGAYRGALATGPTSDVTQSTQALRQQRATLQAEYQQKREFMKPEHPEMQSLQAQIAELDKAIARESAQMSSSRNNTLLQEYRAAAAAERALQGRVAALKSAVLDLRGRSIQYNILQREVDTNRSLYDALLQRYKEIGVAGGIGSAPVSIVDRADVPLTPFKPNLVLNLFLGLVGGLLAGLGAAVGLEFINDTIKTREDVRNKLGLACLGAVPKTSAKDAFVEDLKNPASVVSEAYSAVVAALRFSTESGMPKVLLVTSTQPGEGKSSTALALAQNFARRERNVLLIDSDLRKPAFKAASDKVGLTKLLTNDEHIESHVVETQHDNLRLLPSGPIPPNPADLLSTGRIRAILSEAAERFDVVIIDGPPTLGLADVPLLSAAATHVMFVVESGRTRTRAAIEALNRIEATGAHIVGATLTKSTDTGGGYGYKRYGYGYGYGKVEKNRTEILMIPQGADS
ncbi:MAG TPA: polysaccharide biosynthesis tyrosine autokinase [Sphingomicrobium sp.]|nr:polysaccharide biosynthesis tyrosine autokinase [Sphingomicrobium sp.]